MVSEMGDVVSGAWASSFVEPYSLDTPDGLGMYLGHISSLAFSASTTELGRPADSNETDQIEDPHPIDGGGVEK